MAVKKRTYVRFADHAPVASAEATLVAAAATDNTVNHIKFGRTAFEVRNEQANSDIGGARVVDANSTTGWQIPNDNTDNDGIEITQGILNDPSAPHVFTVGTDGAFELRVKLGVPDVSDYDVCHIGFREVGSYVDAINTAAAHEAAYDEKAAIGHEAGTMNTLTSLAGSDTDTTLADTWADDEVKELAVLVSSAGAVTYEIDGSSDANAVAFSFADATVVVPYMIFCKAGTAADTPPILEYYYCGLQ